MAAKKRGRPSKYDPTCLERVQSLCERGATDREVARHLGISVSTLYEWKIEFPDFSESLKTGKSSADDRVEASLYHRAVGYSFDAEKIFQFQGEPVRVAYVEHVPPDPTSAIFWLKNRRPDEWREKSEQKLTVDATEEAKRWLGLS